MPADLQRHIAWDIGAAEVTRLLSALLDAPAFLGGYSRLLIDLNRPFGSRAASRCCRSDAEIPGNVGLAPERAPNGAGAIIFEPFHDRRGRAARPARGRRQARPGSSTIHSFTPVFLGVLAALACRHAA